MTERELNIALREMARANGLCDEWYAAWGDDDSIDLCLERYIRGFDFAVENDYPPLDFIRKNFNTEDLHRHNIYIDEEVDIEADKSGYYVFLGKCKGTLTVDGFVAVTVYVKHTSSVNVEAFNGSKVFVSYYDKSEGECGHDGWSKCRRYDRRKEKQK